MRALETKEWGRPLALGTVVRDAISKKEMMPLENYMGVKESIYQRSWSISPWQIVSWGLRQIGLTGGHGGEDKVLVDKLVILSNVEDATKEVLRRMSSHTSRVDRIYSKQMFYREYENVLSDKHPMSPKDLEVLLKHLSRDKAQAAYDGQTIKFKDHSDTEPPTITSEDVTIASLKNLIIDLDAQVETLTTRINKLSMTARDAVSRKNRVAALAALRSKKLAESQHIKQSAVLGQLEDVYAKIGQAADQVELVRIMEGSTGVLKSLHREIGGVERVDDVVDQLKEQMTQVDEVGGIIAEIGQDAGAIDEGEVDDELEALERDDREMKEEVEGRVREEKEQREAAKTKYRLALLDEAEREARITESKNIAAKEQTKEALVDKSTESLQQLSL